ncbi:MAG: response regulator [Micavibrio aeruginosavorus]|nr:response regulator [Micavibrio aeruginosavorus]
MRILFVEDDKNLGRATAEGLRGLFAVDWVTSAEQAEDALATTAYGMMVLDVNLPGMSGLELLERLRGRKEQIPVLLLTARDAVRHRVEGLNAGADDYLVKPFDLDELLARCSALLRRAQGHAEPAITVADIAFFPASGKQEKGGAPVILSGREKAIFDVLIHNLDHPVSKAKIEERIYDWASEDIESNTVEVHIASLRKKLGRDLIRTIRGVGYIIAK